MSAEDVLTGIMSPFFVVFKTDKEEIRTRWILQPKSPFRRRRGNSLTDVRGDCAPVFEGNPGGNAPFPGDI
jgi:hypothetical protein